MDDRDDPSVLFFGKEDVDLYAVLKLESSAKTEDIKKAYRKLALVYHPDKHATSDDAAKAEASHKFQQISFAFTILGDEKRRERYDKTGKTDEGLDMGEEEGGWEAYFEDLFDRVTKEKLDEMKKEYQGSDEEVDDLKQAYTNTDGSIDEIMKHIPHSTHDDEARFIVLISKLIRDGELPSRPTWESSIKDEKAKLVRKKQADKEAKEAEDLARELGVWDEFYGSGKAGPRKGKGKGKAKKDEEDEGDVSALQALILKKQKKAGGFLDSLAAKYAEPKPRGKGKRKSKDEEVEEAEEPPKKRKRGAATAADPPEIDDAEFEKLQKKLFGDKAKPSSSGSGSSKGAKGGRGKRTKT
ncbi:DnaJ-domain-containing protein [Dentipellis sp. KUC8613]|nr:DnaJ-domain-containing protein [Dentipellis sp. KUC8613]